MPFLYKLHYTLHIPMTDGGLDVGMLVMGAIAVVWMLDAFIALYISFPSRKVWKPALQSRTNAVACGGRYTRVGTRNAPR
jgi:uncharacterized iron-regulated membrane protein